MKRTFFIGLLLVCAINTNANPSFTIGSNPYLTIFAYPHDLLRWPSSAVYLQFSNQKFPWQGDVNDIFNRPSESYTNSYQSVEFAPPQDYSGNASDIYSWMNTKGYAYKREFKIGGIQTTPNGKLLGEIGATTLRMKLSAHGVARADESANYALVPFNSETKGGEYNFRFKTIYARQIAGNPFGAKIDFSLNQAAKPSGSLSFSRDGSSYTNNHMTWGWATSSCNHIFGYSHINADAFYQNRYSVMKGYQLDLQTSYELAGNHKSGIRYRRVDEKGDNYRWIDDDETTYAGHYEKDGDWITRNTSNMIRGYSKVNYWTKENLDAGILFFVQHDRHSSFRVNKNTLNDPASEERRREFIVETNPYFNFKFNGGYVDFGVLVEGSYTRTRNLSNRWNENINGEEQNVVRNSSPSIGWSSSWESFSQGYDLFFATGCEMFSSVNIYKRLSFLGSLTLLKKYTRVHKSYGNSVLSEGAKEYSFDKTHSRNLTKNETWMTGSIGFSHGFGPFQAIGIFQLPLAYLNKRQTKLKEDKELVFEHERKNMWQVQEPTSFRLLLVYSFGGGGHPVK